MSVGHRPISQSPAESKIFEAIINQNLTDFCKKTKKIPDEQFGFKYKHSTVHALNKLYPDMNKYVHDQTKVGAVLIDLEKAFDSVCLDGLIFKLNREKFPPELILMVYDMIHGKSFIITDSINLSTVTFTVEEGLQQGTVNSPLLFNIFTADVLKLTGLNEINSESHAIGFADDLVVYAAHRDTRTMQIHLNTPVNKINSWYMNWNLRVNPDKCQCILFRKNISSYGHNQSKLIKEFNISAVRSGTGQREPVPRKSCKIPGCIHRRDAEDV